MHHTQNLNTPPAPTTGDDPTRDAILRAYQRLRNATPTPVITPGGARVGMVRPSPGNTYIGTLDAAIDTGAEPAFTHTEHATPDRAVAHVLTEHHRQTVNARNGRRPHHPHSIREGQTVTLPAHRTEATVQVAGVFEHDETWTITATNGDEWDLTTTDRVRIHP